MGGNLLQGPIPQSLKASRGIQIIDLSHNNLSGKIPEFLMNVSFLEYLDLSYNDLDGKVPKEGIFANASAVLVRGNKKLCGGIKELRLPVCNEQVLHRNPPSRRTIIYIVVGSLFFILVLTSCNAISSLGNWQRGVSYIDIFKSTNGFSLECLIGEGSFGSVYRGILGDQNTVIAIKVLNLQQEGDSKSFVAECDALKNIRHRNLVKILTVCSSVCSSGNDFKALIFEYMPNGSLKQWLHSTTDDRQQLRTFSLTQRRNIAIDVASALEYLHHGCEETIVHCDIKPSNVLLDMDMTAHVGDFGLVRFLFDATDNQAISSGLKGSIGYIPPEYGTGGQVSIHGDMYSYGILLLEMFTRKRPTDDMFKDGLSLYELVSSAFPDRVLDILDTSLLSDAEAEDDDENSELGNANESEEAPVLCRKIMEANRGNCLFSVITIALSCCAPL